MGLLGIDITASARLSLQKEVVVVSVSHYNGDIVVYLFRSRVIYNEPLLRLTEGNGQPAFPRIVIVGS